jgi:hypothetical protein
MGETSTIMQAEDLAFIMKDSIALVERVITLAETNGNITDEVDHLL